VGRDTTEDRDAARRQEIIDAARACFLQYGYGKTSLEDIARRANLSRPLLYRKFKNKEEIFTAVYETLIEQGYPAADRVIEGTGSRRDKLVAVYEALLVPVWQEMSATPTAAELFEACGELFPEVEAHHRKIWLKYLQAILGQKDLAEVFLYAVDGFMNDMPTVEKLRRRIRILADHFG
jgi:AcrR family transcriptional regulator